MVRPGWRRTAGRLLAAGLLIGSSASCRRAANAASATSGAGPVLVFAAADLREALPAVAAAYRATGGDSVTLVFGSTGGLAAQIANGAPADLFFSADEGAIARLADAGAVDGATRRVYAVGQLALVTAPSVPPVASIAALTRPGLRTIAIADPAHAPYGRAAQQAMERAGVWTAVRPRIVYAPNVAQALRFVLSGNADAGIVALAGFTELATRPAFTAVDSALYSPLRQSAALVRGAAHAAAARRFLTYATGAPGFAVLQRYGFLAPHTSDNRAMSVRP